MPNQLFSTFRVVFYYTKTEFLDKKSSFSTVCISSIFFFRFQEELDLSAPNKTAMLSLPKEKKWQIYCSQKGALGNETGLSNDPESYIENVNHLSGQEFAHELEENRQRAKGLDSLQIALRTQPNSFVMRFMEAEGLTQLLDFLAAMDYETRQSSIHTALLGCIKALMNNSVSKNLVLHNKVGQSVMHFESFSKGEMQDQEGPY